MTPAEILTAAELEFGAAQIVTRLAPHDQTPRSTLEVRNPSVDKDWREAAVIVRLNGTDGVQLAPPLHPRDLSDWMRAKRLA